MSVPKRLPDAPGAALVVIPALNEEGKIGRVVRKVSREPVKTVLVVDDGSRDATAREAREAGATVISHPVNRGVGAAIRTGIDFALENGYEIVIVVSGDDQHEPAEIPRVLSALADPAVHLVQGSRRLPGGRTEAMPVMRFLLVRVYSWLLRRLSGFPYTDGTNGFRAFKVSLLDDGRIDLWQPWLDTYELEPYLLFKAATCGFGVREVPVTIRYANGDPAQWTKMKPFRDWWRIARPLVFLALGLRR
jgi:dolichol-phosphate mannosyltransferase